MKTLLFLSLCTTSFCYCQTPDRHFSPERKDNVVLIETQDSDSLAYDQILQLLSANEWFIDQQDRKNFVIKTAVRPIPALISAETYLLIKKTASSPTTIRITAYLKATISGNTVSDEVNYVGAENGAYKKSFYEMQAIAKAYQNCNVYYGKQP